jgi:hypothetical protein
LEFLEYLHNKWLLKKGSSSWSPLVQLDFWDVYCIKL